MGTSGSINRVRIPGALRSHIRGDQQDTRAPPASARAPYSAP
jgi:hypothetical protein